MSGIVGVTKTLALFFLSVLFASAYGQLSPPLFNFSPSEYQGNNQIWDIAQNQEGDLFFANHDELLHYDGANWDILKIDRPTIFRAVHHFGNAILSGGLMDFGMWIQNDLGVYQYQSIVDQMGIKRVDGESFWNITVFQGYLIFQSLERVIIIDQELENYQQIDGQFSANSLVYIEGVPYLIDLQKGLFKLFSSPKNYWQLEGLSWASIIGTIKIKGQHYLVSSNGNLYLWGEEFSLLEADLKIPQENIYSIHQMKSGLIILGTVGNGIVWLTNNLEFNGSLERSNGLENNTVLSLFEDRDSNLWSGLDRGIALVNIGSPHLEHRNSSKDIGSVYTAVEWNNGTYIGTNQGLYFLSSNQKELTKIKGIEGQIWKLDLIENILFCSANNGLYKILDSNNSVLISNESGFWGVQKHKQYLIGGTYNGLYIFDYNEGDPQFKIHPEELKVSSRFYELEENKIYVNNEYLGVFVLEFDREFKSVQDQWTLEKKGTKSALFKLDEQLYYKSSEGIFAIEQSTKTFVIDTVLTSVLKPSQLISSELTRGIDHQLIGFKEQSIFGIRKNFTTNSYSSFEYELPSFVFENLGNSGFENINYLSDERYLIGLSDGFVIVDFNRLNKEVASEPSISKVQQLIKNSWVTQPLNLKDAEFNYQTNSIRFSVRIPSYDKYSPLVYETQLIHNGELYAKQKMIPEVTFLNLEPGAYEFQLMTPHQTTNDPRVNSSYAFTIEEPWFLQKTVQIVSTMVLLLILFFAFLITRRVYKKRERALAQKNQKKLDFLQLKEKERINKINQKTLENQLKNKKRELTISTEHLLSKNRLLEQLSKKIHEVEKKHHIDLSNLHEFINDNIKEKKDWNRFEKALADYDEEFVKRIKNQFYQKISRQDFLLMTYIRGGMNSKDIAQVLGISVKSVEMRRYRLRKKLGLNEVVSLTDYINNL